MFPILLRVLTIAGSCTIAALLTRRYLQYKAEQDDEFKSQTRRQAAAKSANNDRQSGEADKSESKASDKNATESTAANNKNGSDEPAKGESSTAVSDEKVKKESKAGVPHSKSQADERAERIARSKEAALAAKKAVDARKRDMGSGSYEAIKPVAEEVASPEGHSEIPLAQSIELSAVTEEPGKDITVSMEPAASAAEERAKVVLMSSKQILDNYKQPAGSKVDLSFAQFSMQTAERLMAQSRFDEAWEKASAVGLLVAVSEMRAAIETQIKSMNSDAEKADRIKEARTNLDEADRCLADASQSFVSDENSNGDFMNQVQKAFQKTTQAQSELMK